MHPNGIDRLSIRSRPSSLPLMYQSWLKLLFIHWHLPPEALQPHIPAALTLDTFDNRAWISITPFAVQLRPVFSPPLPWLGSFHEINLRTYVHYRGVPGIWFFSLDADRLLAVLSARIAYRLPYRWARISMIEEEGGALSCVSHRHSGPHAEFAARWEPGAVSGKAAPESLEFFLVERYCLYTYEKGQLFRGRIFHEPWTLQEAVLKDCRSTMLQAHGLRVAGSEPRVHYSAAQHVAVWPLERV